MAPKRFRREQCRPERRSVRPINVCERTDEPWRLPAEVMCRVQREKTWYSAQRGCIPVTVPGPKWKSWLKESLRVQSEWSSLQHELEVARKIQQDIVPCKFPAFPDRGDIDVYGQMIPARQVGGDFFDFFLLDDNRLGFVIGDVSGKGVPAAIFMAVSRGLLKAVASRGLSPGKCLDEVNRMLCSDNEEGMFVTVFYAVLNTETGTLAFSSAGHHAPYLLRPPAQCGELEIDTGLVLGVLKSTQYQTQSTRLVGGDRLFLFTDGVTEAMNAQEDFYGDERLAGTLAGLQELALDELVDGVVHSVRAFSHGTTQSDDITAMVVSYQQP